MPTANTELTVLTKEIVCAYVQNNPMPASDLPGFVEAVHRALRNVDLAKAASGPKPAVPVEQSVFEDHIICLETGKKFLTLTKHLSAMGMKPAEYRRKWGLPASYPMNAPAYSASRADKARAVASRARGEEVSGEPAAAGPA
ncbi:MucR family transcriptional regulator [Xanthobacter sp. DSM 14520]|uniref:MucR family transcriptional regulator n=1 Tax=Xanthobacter autotrophicus (strain ATCC BAA-1158 / Py2) TaxID=78245 RepID=UPI0037261D7F